jgi:hypothetical protein
MFLFGECFPFFAESFGLSDHLLLGVIWAVCPNLEGGELFKNEGNAS